MARETGSGALGRRFRACLRARFPRRPSGPPSLVAYDTEAAR
ncbi:MAG: hypothetical protein JWM73_1409 [Solirubrobacterales bacterium]|nr:hypothetical protein [Solirubrobacterales bacterium]